MRLLAALLLLLPAAAGAQIVPSPVSPAWDPTQRYITAGQDEPGYRSWYLALPARAHAVRHFNEYLKTWGVAGIVPTWQLLRTASAWERCGASPFEVPPTTEWPNIVQTLRYIRDRVVPVIGPVEPVSGYRNPALNICAGGANESAHRFYQAVDLVPLRPISRETLMRDLCAMHRRAGEPYAVGLGFYAFHRFHIDTRKFRNWGFAQAPEAEQCRRDSIPVPPAAIDLPSAPAPAVDPAPPPAAR